MRALLLAAALAGCGGAPPPPAPTLSAADASERKAAIYALSPAKRREQLEILLSMATDDPDSSVRQLAIGVAGMTGDPRAIPVFVTILQDWSNSGTQLAAATALGNLKQADACEAMLDALVHWPQPPRDMIVNELRAAIIRTPDPCEAHVRARLRAWPDEMREILGEMK